MSLSTGTPVNRVVRIAVAFALLTSAAACTSDVSPTSALHAPGSAAYNAGNTGNAGDHLPAPTNVSATVNGTSVTVSWTGVAGAGQYQVDLCSTASCSMQRSSTTSVTFTNVAPGSYSVRIRARTDVSANQTGQNDGWGDAANATATVAGPSTVNDNNPVAPSDHTPPVITYVVSGTQGDGGWYTSNATVTWTVVDAESAISSQVGCAPSTLSSDTAGQTYACTATSAGGTSSVSVTVKRDATVPVVAFSGNTGAYTVDQTVAITCSATDAMSGIAAKSCNNVAGDAYLFPLGANAFPASATDNAGNAASANASFTVTVTYGSLCSLVKRWVTNAGVANSLCVKLTNASAAAARGDLSAKAGLLGAFANEVQAQTGKFIPADKVAILVRLAAAL